MSTDHIPCMYFPTQLMLVDNDRELLNQLSFALSPQYRCQYYTSPGDALRYLMTRSHEVETLFSQYMTVSEEQYDTSKPARTLDSYAVHRQIYKQPVRFELPVVLVVDYSMPEMDGLTFCRQLKKYPFKKIMLTGDADKNFAVSAFNAGDIDRFLMKDEPNRTVMLKNYIEELNEEYFSDLSKRVVLSIDTDLKNILTEESFCSLFKEIIAEHHIAEYYLLNHYGCFLMLDAYAAPYWFVVITEPDMERMYEIAADDHAPTMALEALNSRTQIPFFTTAKDEAVSAQYWLLHPAEKLIGKNTTIYYALIKGSNRYKIDKDQIISYHEYLTSD